MIRNGGCGKKALLAACAILHEAEKGFSGRKSL